MKRLTLNQNLHFSSWFELSSHYSYWFVDEIGSMRFAYHFCTENRKRFDAFIEALVCCGSTF